MDWPLISKEANVFNGLGIEDKSKEKRLVGELQKVGRVAASDASATGICAYGIKGDRFFIVDKLTGIEKQYSSGLRELVAIKRLTENFGGQRLQGQMQQTLLWLTYSQNLVSFMTKGSMKEHIQKEVFSLFKLCRKINITIKPWHLSREDPRIKLADEGSRITDKDIWEVELETLTSLEKEWGHTSIDLFADYFKRKKRRFTSQFAYGKPEFVDTFSKKCGATWKTVFVSTYPANS